ncbi:Fusaric acid resistance protein-like-domain-containing protein [Lipomyces tetrasporus]|uniref:Fusaric acid resistance protein-like-domain-containing protein n=1 Tax=Lipomyces tetrasporus TaxID=54092 RepID=A0AAD7QR26_9ASCO|nr:Fusaric acid resistance protein-like-domain-containing protein [Lipomyces tetrasporus]KAJ8099913.1 Fusaric acid resistance protein-like-domain-containing protein [Lipomyces tetrasporus]
MGDPLGPLPAVPESADGPSDVIESAAAVPSTPNSVSPGSTPITEQKPNGQVHPLESAAKDVPPGSTLERQERPRYSMLRNYSLILPMTGERVRRQITLDTFDSRAESSGRQRLIAEEDLDDEAGEDTALLVDDRLANGSRVLMRKTSRMRRWVSRHCANFERRLTYMVQSIWWIKWIYDNIFFREFTRPLKCSLTYFLASLTVFSSTISSLLGSGDGKHLTATVTVYFHPSRTVGSMIEAFTFAELALVYSTILSCCSMVTAAFFRKLDLLWVGYAIVLVVFCAGGLGSIALMKHKMGKQTFNTACSVASTAFTRILVREGSVQEGIVSFSKILQVGLLVNIGVFIAATVCFTVFPVTANSKLKAACNKLMNTYSHILAIITKSFLSGTDVSKTEIEELFQNAGGLISSLDSIVQEVKYEHYVRGTEAEYFLQMRLVKSIQSITQHLGGLRSSLQMQWNLTNLHPGQTRSSCGELFDIFVYYLGPPMKSLTYTIKNILEVLPFDDKNSPKYEVRLNSRFGSSLNLALDLFSSARMKALKEIYSQDIFSQQANRAELAIHLEKVASTCGLFSQGLEDLAREIYNIIDILKEYENYAARGRPKSWWWLLFWKANPMNVREVNASTEEDVTVPSNLAHLFSDDNIGAKHLKETSRDPWTLKLWRALRMFRRNDVRFGIKVGVGALLFTLPAYIPQTRESFSHYRGEWGLATFVLMTNISIGGTTSSVLWRLSGTIIGCYSAWLAWYLFSSNRVALALIGLLIAFPCFCIILGWKNNSSFGRFILLAFNLTALYSYSLSQNDIDRDDRNEDEGGANPIVSEIAFHRLVSVSSGVLWSLFITLYIWPNSARANVKRKLSILWIRMGLIWKNDPLNSLSVRGAPLKPYVSIQDEQKVQKSLLNMRTSLMPAAANEFRLKGPFPTKHYANMMKTTQEVLDVYHNMNSMIMKDLNASEREAQIIAYTIEERKELSNRIFLLFYLIAAALRLNLPLPYDLPNTTHARDRMIVKINEYRMKQLSEDSGTEDDFVLFYAFILATMSINDGLLNIISSLQEVYGSIEEETLSI